MSDEKMVKIGGNDGGLTNNTVTKKAGFINCDDRMGAPRLFHLSYL